MPFGLANWTRMNWKTCLLFSLMMSAYPSIAQESALDEEFLLFLANGLEMDGEWQDPISLGEMLEVEAVAGNTADDLPDGETDLAREEDEDED